MGTGEESEMRPSVVSSLVQDLSAEEWSGDALLEQVDSLRLEASHRLDEHRKGMLGQFFTPLSVARFMASMLVCSDSTVRILDAGAGVGSLFAACVAELCSRPQPPQSIHVNAYELDATLAVYLSRTIELCHEFCEQRGVTFVGVLHQEDFLVAAADMMQDNLFVPQAAPPFTCAILNPPYHKIHSDSHARNVLRRMGIETSNMYAGFLAATSKLLSPEGELIAITPRSFCNGPYFRSFRKDFLRTLAPDRFHVFESRQQAFRDDEVLQENIIFHAVKVGQPAPRGPVQITSSAGPEDDLVTTRTVRYTEVVRPGDTQSFIHLVPDHTGKQVAHLMGRLHATLDELGLSISTGRVVDFRAQQYLRLKPEADTYPLVYPAHFIENYVTWPQAEARKPNALSPDVPVTQLVPNQHYVLTKRFTSKEEKRRVVAAVYDADRVPAQSVGFENHLNYYHRNGQGLPLSLARGLAAFLNSTLVDAFFRQFNGHTQVNATDLRSLRYPSRAQLEALGAHIGTVFPDQREIDTLVEKEVFGVSEEKSSDPILIKRRVDETLGILRDLGLPRAQQNERSALTLLALLNLQPTTPWAQALQPLVGIHAMLQFFDHHYGKTYAENSRETVRRQTVHQFLDAGLIVANPDEPTRAINSGKTVYQIDSSALELLRTYGSEQWEHSLRAYLASVETLKARYAQERAMVRIPVTIAPGKMLSLSPGGQNVLVEHIIHEFAPRYTPGGRVLYVGDTDTKFAYFDEEALTALGVIIETHGKMPDVIIHYTERDWLVLIEAVTSHGPINPKRHDELKTIFEGSSAGLVYVTTFLSRKAMTEYLDEISWETDVWVAEAPTHLIHFNGERFLGPY